MLFKSKVQIARPQPDFAIQSIFTSIFNFFIVISFREYFLFLPNFSRTHQIIAYVQVLTALGWILLIIVPPIVLLRWSDLGKLGPILLLISALIWPISTILIKILNLSFYGNPYMGYMKDRPLFVLMEYLIPGFYLYIWRKKRSQL